MRAGDFWGERGVPSAPVTARPEGEPPALAEPPWWQGERRLAALVAEIREQVRPRAEALLAALAREQAVAEAATRVALQAEAEPEPDPEDGGSPAEPGAAAPEPTVRQPAARPAAAPRLIAIPGLEEALGGGGAGRRAGRG